MHIDSRYAVIWMLLETTGCTAVCMLPDTS